MSTFRAGASTIAPTSRGKVAVEIWRKTRRLLVLLVAVASGILVAPLPAHATQYACTFYISYNAEYHIAQQYNYSPYGNCDAGLWAHARRYYDGTVYSEIWGTEIFGNGRSIVYKSPGISLSNRKAIARPAIGYGADFGPFYSSQYVNAIFYS